MSDNIKVVVKVRPLIPREKNENLQCQWRVDNNSIYQLDQSGNLFGPSFTFDKVYDENTQTIDVYNDIAKPVVEAATTGINGTIFAYGQTSSGKTYTMTGMDGCPGIIPLAIYDLFDIIKTKEDRDFLLRVSYMEIYNETLIDLFNTKKTDIKIHDSHTGGVKIDVKELVTSSPEEILEYMKMGQTNRHTGATKMNEESSRSHSIFQITIESREHATGEGEDGCVNVSTLNLVDLAGSERSGQTGAIGKQFKEGTHINKSLSMLGLVIKQLSEEGTKFVNFRSSKLTRILQNSLGGNAKTSIICAVTPAAAEETISTLQFANRAKSIKNKPQVNAVSTDRTMIQKLTKKLLTLQNELEVKKTLEQDNRNLQEKIKALQRQILNGFGDHTFTSELSRADRRRTWCAPRRMTIDTLHTIEEIPGNPVPKFRTPSLKYNPSMFPEQMTTQSTNKLATVSEEASCGRITPPARNDRRVNFSEQPCDDIIEVETSKTPPCRLRENAKEAERNYQEIVELTGREKIYQPEVVELMNKLEQNTNVIAKLEEHVNLLNEKVAETTTENETLKDKIAKAEQAIETIASEKMKIETSTEKIIQELNTKITDAEVIYETLKRKSKTREEELLSQLNEIRSHKNNGKSLSRTLDKENFNFMDLSKDISLVNSDAENSVAEDEAAASLNNLVTNLNSQLSSKTELVLELEAKLHAKETEMLASSSDKDAMKVTLASLNEKLSAVENENSILEASIVNLNSTIKSLQENLEAANRDNDSYNEMIKDLQLKIKEQEKVTVVLDDSALETMIANEEKLIANNENLRNIIHSLKIMVDARNKEITSLKATSVDVDNLKMEENLTTSRTEIERLENELDTLKNQLNEKLNDIKILSEENQAMSTSCDMKEDMQILKEQIEKANKENEEATSLLEKAKDESRLLTAKIESDSAKVEALHKQVDNLQQTLTNLSEENQVLKDKIEKASVEKAAITSELDLIKSENVTIKAEHSNSQVEFTSKLHELQNEVDRLNEKISGMETEILNREKEILSLRELSQEHANVISTATDKIFAFIARLTGKDHEPTDSSNIEVMIQSLSYCVDSLAETAQVIEFERNVAAKDSSALLIQYEQDTTNYQNVISALEAQVATLTKESQTSLCAINKLTDTNASQLMEIEEKTEEIDQLKNKLQATISDREKLEKALEEKNQAVISTEAKVSDLIKETENLTNLLQERNDCDEMLKKQIDTNASYLKEINKGCSHVLARELHEVSQLSSLSDPYKTLIEQMKTLTQSVVTRDETLQNILDKLNVLIETTKIENTSDFESGDYLEKYKQIPGILGNVIVHMTTVEQEVLDMAALKEATAHIQELKTVNNKLENELYDYKENYLKAMAELDSINRENKSLNRSLLECNELLEKLQTDMVSKKYEFENIERSTRKFKDDFTSINQALNNKIKELEADNETLRRQLETLKEQKSALNENKDLRKSLTGAIKQAIRAPRSLTSISLDRIIEVIAVNQWRTDASTSESTHSLIEMSNKGSSDFCEYNTYTVDTELKETKEDNTKLKALVDLLKTANKQLIEEQNEVRKELNLLLEPAMELQKKICNHRTNISTLTATTYAENKALQSQVKVLQYYHSRLHNVVQRDISSFKKRLTELFSILKIEAENNANNSFKRFSLPDVLDKNKSVSATFRNDSTLDGDLLMLDNNDTLASIDSTLVGHVQDFDKSQLDAEVTFSSNLDYTAIDQKLAFNEIEKLTTGNLKIHEALELLEQKACDINESNDRNTKVDVCENCKHKTQQLQTLTDALNKSKEETSAIEEKYNQLKLEVPSSESLVRKLRALEKDHKNKLSEIASLTSKLSNTNHQLKHFQEENEALSTQVMDNITEVDKLRAEMENITVEKANLEKKCLELEKSLESSPPKITGACPQCLAKKKTLQEFSDTESLLNRSQRGLETSLRHSKICTLQNELQASREDCQKITEEFATIMNQLDRSNLSINQTMDDSMGESNIFTLTKDFDSMDTQTSSKFATNMPNIVEEKSQDIYTMDKTDCFNYFIEKTGAQKENLDRDLKIIDIMRMLYNNLMTKHANEVENLLNELRTFNESNIALESQIGAIKVEYSNVRKELEEKSRGIEFLTKTVESVTHGINTVKACLTDGADNTKFVSLFKENILNTLDTAFTLSTTPVFDYLVDSIMAKHQSDLSSTEEKYIKVQEQMQNLVSELTNVNENVHQMKQQLIEKEKEYNLLKLQKEKVYEISNAVTLDIVKKQQELSETITKGCSKLLDCNLIDTKDIDLCMPLKKNIGYLFEFLVQNTESNIKEKSVFETEKENLIMELTISKSRILEKERELDNLKSENDKNIELHRSVSQKLLQKESELNAMQALREEYEKLLSEQNINAKIIQKLNDEISTLEETVAKKQTLLHSLENQMSDNNNVNSQVNELVYKIKKSESEIAMLKSVNDAINKEREKTALNLAKSNENLHSQNEKIDRMTKELERLETSLKDTLRHIETLENESTSVLEENKALKEEIKKLQFNNKTHEKSVEIQSSMIKRLLKQKEEDSEKYSSLKAELDAVQAALKSSKEELSSLQTLKECLEIRVADLESGLDGGNKERLSIDYINSNVRRRRQSIYDSKRQFGEDNLDHSKADSIFSTRSKPDDLFVDCEDDSSNRSTPAKSTKRRESSLGKTDQSGEEANSRPSSVAAVRSRRQSIHDLHRSVRHTPSPRESLLGTVLKEDLEISRNAHSKSDVDKLKSTLAACQQELEELKERYRELDEECETCAEYLRERDEQCMRLRKEKVALEGTIAKLKRLSSNAPKRSYSDAAVNTDEDWTKLHSVVVDRMSFDAQVEKTKRLTKAIEEFRMKNRELRATNAKMHKALDKYAERDYNGVVKELQETKQELESYKEQLSDLQRQYKELDEECETCAEYLRARDEQILKLKEAKLALEKKLEEGQAAGVPQSSRKKRRSLHDQNRASPQAADYADAATDTCDDLLSYQVERDSDHVIEGEDGPKDVKHLAEMVERLTRQKAYYEQQANRLPVFVATGSGIVQDQQITDVLKENKKLKKMNAKLISICKKRGKEQIDEQRENDPTEEV